MQCPKCGYEPRDRLLSSPCPNPDCQYIWWDTEDYVRMLADPLVVDSALDIGCGNKGVIAQSYWESRIKQGYACDIHVIKELPPIWTPLKMDAVGLVDRLGVDGVDFLTHCGMLEHVPYEHAFEILNVIEQVAKKRVFFTCSALVREVDYKVRRDGNPFHYYKSFWDPKCFEILGYHVDLARMGARETFTEEITGWFEPENLKAPWPIREQALREHVALRSCFVEGCDKEPVGWHVDKGVFCYAHGPGDIVKAPLHRWFENEQRTGEFPYPPGREPRPLR